MTWRQARHWADTTVPIKTRLAAMADGGRTYLKALHAFHAHLISQGTRLTDMASVDRALHNYIVGLRRAQAEHTVSAMIKAYPPLRLSLPWSYAAMKQMAASTPTTHHPPMPWGVALLLAYGLSLGGYARRSRALLLQWRLGLRPGELCGLRVDDIWLLQDLPSVIRLGRRRSLKVRRQQAIRVEADDWRTMALLWYFVRSLPAGSALCDWSKPTQINAALRWASDLWGLTGEWTSHTPRAGWATANWHRGVQFAELRERGRWTSDGVLRMYLDVITAIDVMSQVDLSRWSVTMEHLDMNFMFYWG